MIDQTEQNLRRALAEHFAAVYAARRAALIQHVRNTGRENPRVAVARFFHSPEAAEPVVHPFSDDTFEHAYAEVTTRIRREATRALYREVLSLVLYESTGEIRVRELPALPDGCDSTAEMSGV